MKVGDQVQNIHTKRVARIKKITVVEKDGKKINIYTIFNDRFDRDDEISEEEFNRHWIAYYPV